MGWSQFFAWLKQRGLIEGGLVVADQHGGFIGTAHRHIQVLVLQRRQVRLMRNVLDAAPNDSQRRWVLTTCSLCRRSFLAHEVQLLDDDAEVFILCRNCRDELARAPLQGCPNCGRGVYFLYPMHGENDGSACAVCRAHAVGKWHGGRFRSGHTLLGADGHRFLSPR